MESMMLEVATCNLELFIFDEFAMNKLCPTGYLVDVNTCLEPEIVEKVKDKSGLFSMHKCAPLIKAAYTIKMD